jgi:high-affinity K+ transport system ATPase subunit B
VLISLLVCLIPTTIGGLLSAIGIAGMDRVMQHNVLAMSGKAVEAAGDVNSLLLDKTGTITLGNRQAVEFIPIGDVAEAELADAAQLSSACRRNPGRPLHRGAGQAALQHPRPRSGRTRSPFHSLHRPDPHERRRY